MRKYLILFTVFLGYSAQVKAQELFVITEPASNVPAGSVSVGINQGLLNRENSDEYYYNLAPTVSWGTTKNLMFKADGFFSTDYSNSLAFRGASLYTKYRFLSQDDLQSHFRMAAFGRVSTNNEIAVTEEIDLMGNNSGFQIGIVATKLIKKVAISATLSGVHATNLDDILLGRDFSDFGAEYTLSVGKLMLPKVYTSFNQTNVNAMLEFKGQTLNKSGKSYLDVVPSIQFIFNSRARLDLAYKQELYSSLNRNSSSGFLLNFQYTFFNVSN